MNEKNEKETYVSKFINLKMMRDATKFLAEIEKELMEADEIFDEAISLVASFFSEEVTYEKIIEGISADDFDNVILDIIYKVTDGETKKKGKSTRLTFMQKAQKEMQEKMMAEEPSKDS